LKTTREVCGGWRAAASPWSAAPWSTEARAHVRRQHHTACRRAPRPRQALAIGTILPHPLHNCGQQARMPCGSWAARARPDPGCVT